MKMQPPDEFNPREGEPIDDYFDRMACYRKQQNKQALRSAIQFLVALAGFVAIAWVAAHIDDLLAQPLPAPVAEWDRHGVTREVVHGR